MIIISVDNASLPPGAKSPGDFLLTSDGTLLQITRPVGTVDNVAAYQAAGIKGPVTITYEEYLARGGVGPPPGF